MDDDRNDKARLRAQALARRDAMGEEARIEASLRVADIVAAQLSFDPGTIISGFLPIRSEIDLRPLMAGLADRGARLCVPAIIGGDLQFRQLVRGAALEPQGFGTYAPGLDAAVLDPEIMLVPIAAFDRSLHRIGYGRGYYDRAVSGLRRKGLSPHLVGTAFTVQEIPAVPVMDHDERLHLIATETGLLRR